MGDADVLCNSNRALASAQPLALPSLNLPPPSLSVFVQLFPIVRSFTRPQRGLCGAHSSGIRHQCTHELASCRSGLPQYSDRQVAFQSRGGDVFEERQWLVCGEGARYV